MESSSISKDQARALDFWGLARVTLLMPTKELLIGTGVCFLYSGLFFLFPLSLSPLTRKSLIPLKKVMAQIK